MRRGRLKKNFSRAAPHCDQAGGSRGLFEILNISPDLLGKIHLVLALFDVRPVNVLNIIMIEYRFARLDRTEKRLDAVEQFALEDAGVGCGGVHVVVENVPAGKDQLVQRRERKKLFYTRRARIGLIGTGWWGTYAHLPSLTTYPAADVVALADPSAERLARAAERFGVPAQFADYREMLARVELEGVVVATPHATHYAIAMDVLSRGVPLMLEKPMVLRAADARHLVRLANEKRVPLVIGYPYHFVEQHAQLRARASPRVRLA